MRLADTHTDLRTASATRRHGRALFAAFGGASLLSLVVTLPARGQDAGAQASGALEEIVVTAQRREENIQDVPISIAAFGAQQLEALGATKLTDIENATPSLSFGSGSGTNRFVGIRGVGDFSRNIGNDARVGVYVDGVYQGRSYSSDPELLGVERVEVLRGPQGTLFGRNTVAGALNITTRKPGYTLGSEFQAELGNYDHMRGAARVDLPLVADKAALALSASHTQRDGYIRNVTLAKDVNDVDVTSGRATLRLDPTDTLEMLISADWLDSQAQQAGSQPLSGPGRPGPYRVAFDADGFADREIWGASGTVNYTLPNDYTLTSITAYRDSSYASGHDEDYLPIFVAVSGLNESNTQFTQEVRLASHTNGKAAFVAGVFYIHQDIETRTSTVTGPIFPLLVPGGTQGIVTTPGEVKVDGMAGFVDGNYWLTDRLQLNAGLRYTREEKEIQYSIFDGTGILTTIEDFRDDRSDSDVSPRLGLNFHLDDDVMFYATAGRASKSGGWNADFVRTVEQIGFDAEEATNVEVGLKSSLFERRMRANLSVFHTRYDDFQVFQFVPLASGGTTITITNAGELTTKGVEAELVFRPIDSLTLTSTVAYTDAAFDEFKNGGGPGVHYDGNRPPFAPEWKAYGAIEYVIPVGSGNQVVAFADYSYTDHYYTNPNNATVAAVDSFGLVSARLSFEMDSGWEFSLWGRNLTDELYTRSRDRSFLGLPRESVDLPRTYGVRATVRF